MVVELTPIFVVLLVTKGTTAAIWTAVPLEMELVVTCAVKLPAAGFLPSVKVTVSKVEVAAVTTPSAPLLNRTVLLASVVSKPNPLMVTVFALAFMFAVLIVMIGLTVPTWAREPLLRLLVTTDAVRLPAVGLVANVTVRDVELAEVTVPVPLLSVTTLFAAVAELNPKPLIVIVVSFTPTLTVLLVITGIIVATCRLVPLGTEFVATDAVKAPTAVGLVV
jgi:hypothetical protein